jgi:hypothetical protein
MQKKRELQACSILARQLQLNLLGFVTAHLVKQKEKMFITIQIILIMMLHLLTFFYKKTISLPLAAFFGGNNRGRFRLPCSFCQATSPSALHSFADSAAGLVRMHPARELAPSLMR